MDEARLRKYAELLVRAGGNVQKGQRVVIGGDVNDAYFVRLVEEYAYDAGASEVHVMWTDDVSTRMRYLRAADEIFDEIPKWMVDRFDYYDAKGAVYLSARSSDPDLLNGVDTERIKRYTMVSQTAIKAHTARTMTNVQRWSLLALPSAPWAKKVFPDLPVDKAVDALWKLILKGARADGDNPVADWAAHKKNFVKRVNYLNNNNFAALRFKNGLGTDFTVKLAKNHIWVGGGDVAKDGVDFFPNLPTEEIFTMPDRAGVDGRVVASMPLSRQGNLIEGFEITFKEGRAVSWKAERNEKVLTDIIEMDEGSHYLGEVALVANSSPIAQMNTLFYNTLFDENASCHLALGKAYPNNMKGGDKLTEAERAAAGMNDSLVHVDFMFGTPDMKITGILQDGAETVFYDSGEFII